MKAERETFDRLLAHFLADRIGATFDGHISGATRAGLFVKLDDTGADGFVPARMLGDDYFRYREDRHALVGDHSGETYRLGDRVSVRLVEAAPVAGALRFELLSDGRRGGRITMAPAAGAPAPGTLGWAPRAAQARSKQMKVMESGNSAIERMNRFVRANERGRTRPERSLMFGLRMPRP